MPLEPPKDDPSIRNRRRPPEIHNEENRHVSNVVRKMREMGIDSVGRIRDTYRSFMIYAFAAEVNLPLQDVMLVQEQLDANRVVFFFAEKLPRDERFAKQYQDMDRRYNDNKDELCRALNEIAALKTEIRNLRGEDGDPEPLMQPR